MTNALFKPPPVIAATLSPSAASPRRIVLPYPPSVNGFYSVFRGRKILSKDGRIYKKSTALALNGARLQKIEGDVTCAIDLFRPRKAGDLDNYMKALLDTLKGHAFCDDSQISAIFAQRFDDKAEPRVELAVFPSKREWLLAWHRSEIARLES